jgi:hypothetical protein
MNLDISTLFPDLEALTPDGRWAMLQKWLKENPEYGERFERWSTLTVDQVYAEIEQMAAKKYGPLATLFFNSPATQIKFKLSIEVLQACYRERAGISNQTEKEIKNVNSRRSKKEVVRRSRGAKRNH